MSQTLRAFIAIGITDQIRRELTAIQDKLRTANADVKWTEPENIHITLQFLGDVPLEKVDALKQALDETARSFSPFEITLGGLGAFPNTHAPRIIWAGIAQGADKVAEIAGLIENKLALLGFQKEERAFSAHITLGRARSPHGKVRLSRAIAETSLSSGLMQKVDRLNFFQSQLTASGPVYSAIHHSELIRK